MSKGRPFTRIGQHADFVDEFNRAAARVLSFVPSDLGFGCTTCFDRGIVVVRREILGLTFELAHFCSADVRSTSGRTITCPASDWSVMTVQGAPKGSGKSAGASAYRADSKPSRADEDEVQLRDIRIRDVLPSLTELESWERTIFRAMQGEQPSAELVDGAMTQADASQVLEAMEAVMELGGGDEEQLAILANTLTAVRSKRGENR